MTQTNIISLNSEEQNQLFKNIVVSDIKGSVSEEHKEILFANIDLWNYTLQTIRRDMELQLSCQKAKVKLQKQALLIASDQDSLDIKSFLDDQEKWRMSALKFLSNIERKSLYVKLLISGKQNLLS